MILSRNLTIFCASIIALTFVSHPISGNAEQITHHHKLLRDIHDEVLQFGINEDPDIIKKEFWMDLDGRESNKEEHVVVMRHNDGLNFRMTVQVTYFSEDKGKRFVRFAKDTKLVQCCIRDHDMEIDRSDYSDEEMEKLFNDILIGIRNKKELLKLIKN
jgi:DNA/RNA endonuclease G (NUC1)